MRTRPRRRYVWRDPDTGRAVMCWRGEAIDRVLRSLGWRFPPLDLVVLAQDHQVWARTALEVLCVRIQEAWRADVRLRERIV